MKPTRTTPKPHQLIHDGDHGSDDFVATLVALGQRECFHTLGITACHGNVQVDRVTRNARLAVEMAGRRELPVCRGAEGPWRMPPREGDEAFGGDGIGGVEFPEPGNGPLPTPAHDWLARSLAEAPEPVTLCVTGPMTNVARLIHEAPECRSRIARIVAMGGCLGPLGPQARRGNITPHAEFNFLMDPDAADFVLRSGLPIVLLPMDVTHELVLTPERRKRMLARWEGDAGEKLARMLAAAEHLDRRNFDLDGAVVHDPHVFLYLLAPELYRSEVSAAGVNTDRADERHGGLERSDHGSPIEIVTGLADAEAAFEILLDSVEAALGY